LKILEVFSNLNYSTILGTGRNNEGIQESKRNSIIFTSLERTKPLNFQTLLLLIWKNAIVFSEL